MYNWGKGTWNGSLNGGRDFNPIIMFKNSRHNIFRKYFAGLYLLDIVILSCKKDIPVMRIMLNGNHVMQLGMLFAHGEEGKTDS